MRMEQVKVYTFDELDENAREVARAWYREGALDYEWWDSVYDWAKEAGRLIGITVDRIYFSGFSSQGDGACFEGRYSYAKGSVNAIKKEFPSEPKLYRIAELLYDVQRHNFYSIGARCAHRGHYYHSGCMAIDVWPDETMSERTTLSELHEEYIIDAMRDFADWIYKKLREEYEYLMSDEQVDETILANEYEFTAEGNRW